MRTDLKLNYGALDAVSSRIKAYYDAIEDMEQALEGLKGVLENQESEAVEKLLEKIGNITTNMEGKKTTLKQLKNILDDYTEDMEALVGAVNRNGRVRADQYDIWYNILQIESPVETLEYNASVAAMGCNSWSLPFEDEEGRQKREKEERNYQRLENLRTSKFVSLAKRLQQNVSDLWRIYDNYIKPFEKTDDNYRKRLNAIYNDRTSGKDKWKNFWDSFGSISVTFIESFAVAFAAAFLLALAPGWLIVGALAVLAVGCVIMANVPEESVPSWLSGAKKAADAVADKAVQVLEEGPIVLVEDIGQGLMDEIQTPEGIAAVSGIAIGMVAGGIAGTKVKAKIKAKKVEAENLKNGGKHISEADRAKLDSWEYAPDDELYLKYKEVFDNPKYYNQKTGEINWPGQNGDPNIDGFLNGKYDNIKLKPGEKIDRYGGNNGTFFGEEGTSIPERAMAPNSDFSKYNKYVVSKEIPVRKGEIAPWFDQPGGGVQYQIDPDFVKMIKGKLRPNEDFIDGLVRMGYLDR